MGWDSVVLLGILFVLCQWLVDAKCIDQFASRYWSCVVFSAT